MRMLDNGAKKFLTLPDGCLWLFTFGYIPLIRPCANNRLTFFYWCTVYLKINNRAILLDAFICISRRYLLTTDPSQMIVGNSFQIIKEIK